MRIWYCSSLRTICFLSVSIFYRQRSISESQRLWHIDTVNSIVSSVAYLVLLTSLQVSLSLFLLVLLQELAELDHAILQFQVAPPELGLLVAELVLLPNTHSQSLALTT